MSIAYSKLAKSLAFFERAGKRLCVDSSELHNLRVWQSRFLLLMLWR